MFDAAAFNASIAPCIPPVPVIKISKLPSSSQIAEIVDVYLLKIVRFSTVLNVSMCSHLTCPFLG